MQNDDYGTNLQVNKDDTAAVIKAILQRGWDHPDSPGVFKAAQFPTIAISMNEGVPVHLNPSDSLLYVCKTGEIYAGATGSSQQLKKNHLFIVGDFLCNGDVSTEITAIDTTTNTTHDVFTLVASMITVTDEVVYLGDTEGTNVATASSAVVEAAVGDTLTISNPYGVNDMKVTISQNTSDALSVSAAGGDLVIKLADTTPGNNTAALIQAAIRAKEETGGINWDLITCVGAANWDTATDGSTITIASDVFAGGEEYDGDDGLAGIDPKYAAHGITVSQLGLVDAVLKEKNLSVAVMAAGQVREANIPFPLDSNGVIKSQLPLVQWY